MKADELDWMALHVGALFIQDGEGRLLRDNESNGKKAPRFFLGRTASGSRCWFGSDVSDSTRAELERLVERAELSPYHEPVDPGPFKEVLERQASSSTVWAGPAYRFPMELVGPTDRANEIGPSRARVLDRYLVEWSADVVACAPFIAVIHDGAAVSLCASVRRTQQADEAGVETHPDFRGRGHAGQAVILWASAVRRAGRQPLYSTSWDNAAAISVAKKLGLIHFGSDLHIA